jgi:hypothetical protein
MRGRSAFRRDCAGNRPALGSKIAAVRMAGGSAALSARISPGATGTRASCGRGLLLDWRDEVHRLLRGRAAASGPAIIRDGWIRQVISNPVREQIQADGRIRRWAPIAEMGNRFLRVVLLPDGETIHNAFFDRRFTP